jgi:hypothetical protein
MVEASRDGRLSAGESQQLREHLRDGCAACRQQTRFLGWLADALPRGGGSDDEVALRRLRRAIVSEAHERLSGASTPVWRRTAVRVAAVVCLALAAGYLYGRTPQIRVTPLTAERNVAQHLEGDREVVVLGEGTYELTVQRNWFDRSVVVHVPDGEIEDVGTVFSVRVEHARTARVHVTRGAVVLHLGGVPELRLLAGSEWSAAPVPEIVAPVITVEPAPVDLVPAEPSELANDHESEPKVAPQKQRHPRRVLHAARAHAEPDAETSVSDENTSEDAVYLRVLDLLHQRRMNDARRLGESYLERFPNGFRRPEIERLVQRVDSQ